MRLFKDGEWRTVVVDDQIPCHGKLKAAYSTNMDPRDGPVAVLEKAFAKLYGCYEHLQNVSVGGALEDLTGGYKDRLYLVDGVTDVNGARKQPDFSAAEDLRSGVFWSRLCALRDGHHLLGATYKRKYAALGGAPAIDTSNLEDGEDLVYPILELRELSIPEAESGGKFVRLRNAWRQIGEHHSSGRAREWDGRWGNNSAEWQNLPAVAAELGGKPRDGSFWMVRTGMGFAPASCAAYRRACHPLSLSVSICWLATPSACSHPPCNLSTLAHVLDGLRDVPFPHTCVTLLALGRAEI